MKKTETGKISNIREDDLNMSKTITTTKSDVRKDELKMKNNTSANNIMQDKITNCIWSGGRQGDLDGGTWHGGRQGDLDGGS